jgi:hypothetical protein
VVPKPILSIEQRIDKLSKEIEARRRKTTESSHYFIQRYGNATAFAEERLRDITDEIRKGDPTAPSSLVKSFYVLNARLFPMEGERETPEGFKAYVQPDHTHAFLSVDQQGRVNPLENERRIIVCLDENKKDVIAATAFGVVATSDDLRQRTQIDGTVGLTYLMVHEDYRGSGIGKHFATDVIPRSAKSFLQGIRGICDPCLVVGAEINDIKKSTFGDALSDFEGALILPNARENFWRRSGFSPLAFDNYIQLKLREELEPFAALSLFVAGWKKDRIPTDLVWAMIETHAVLCLNKQRGLDENDRAVLEAMRVALLSEPMISFRPDVENYRERDIHVLEVMKRAAQTDSTAVNALMSEFFD